MSNIIDSVKRTVMGDKATDNTSKAHDSSYGPSGASAQRSNFATTGDHDVTGIHDRGIPKQTDVAGDAKHNEKGGSLLAKMTDPRGEFDKDTHAGGAGSRHTGAGTTLGSNTHGSTNVGPHDSNIANKVDPRVDSDRDGRAAPHSSAGFGSTTHSTSTTAGPHSSNIANKLDPRVDSDRDNRANPHSSVGGNTYGTTQHSTRTAGPHSSDAGNKLDPRVDSDRDHRGTHHSTVGGTTLGSSTHGSTNVGPHDSNIANKLDPRVDSDRDNRGSTHSNLGGNTYGATQRSTHTAGPHSSDAANKFDPRVDSDRDNRGAHGPTHTNILGGVSHSAGHGPHNSQQAHSLVSGPTATHGPHSSNIGNKLDPRVDSDRDNRANPQSSVGGSGGYGMGMGATSHQTSTAGPHDSKIANKLDPRVDSDRDHRANPQSSTGGTHQKQHVSSMIDGPTIGSAGAPPAHGTHGTHGPHDSKMANKADPRVDSDRDHRANPVSKVGGNTTSTAGTTHHGPSGLNKTHNDGPAPNTAGPHKSDILNKLDPRVDSDRDGSKTIGSGKY